MFTLDGGDLVGVLIGIWTWLIEIGVETLVLFWFRMRIWWFDWSAWLSPDLMEVWRSNWLIHK